jgi:hypothetical protein
MMIDFLIGRVLWFIVFVTVAIVVAQHFKVILSLLLAGLFMLAIARLLWPSPHR